jgi:hypothetical protein
VGPNRVSAYPAHDGTLTRAMLRGG